MCSLVLCVAVSRAGSEWSVSDALLSALARELHAPAVCRRLLVGDIVRARLDPALAALVRDD